MERADIPALIATLVLLAPWALFAFYNVVFQISKLRRMSSDGPSPAVIVGSVCGIGALLAMPGLGWTAFFALLPLALLPDLAWVGCSLLIRWRETRRPR